MRLSRDPLARAARMLAQRLDELGVTSDEPGGLTRTFLSPAMDRATSLVCSWMRLAGLTVREDAAGNVIGRWEPAAKTLAGASRGKTLLLGSHLDTVRNAGRFDGALGVLLPIAAIAELRRRGLELPFAIEVLGFSEEETVRFSTAYIGSKAFTGRLTAADLKATDAQGISLRAAMEAHGGGRVFRLPKPAHRKDRLLGYVEVHIEQGPVLETDGLAVGVVSAIASQTRGWVTFRGKAGHAGTTPMNLRRDALAGAAEFILLVEKFAGARPPLVATVGTLAVPDGAVNVIPGSTTVSLDVRHPSDVRGRQAVDHLIRGATAIARRRELKCDWQQTMRHRATACSKEVTTLLRKSVATVQSLSPQLVSGAGHDAVVMAEIAPVAMLLVRCRGGLSHHPDEYVAPADLECALRVMIDFILRLAARERARVRA